MKCAVSVLCAATAALLGGCGSSDDPVELKNIVGLAQDTSSLSTLVKAVTAGGLVDTLSGKGPFTVFAPTNAAFAALPDGTLDNLLEPANKDQLVSILTYHVLPAEVKAGDLKAEQSVKTVEGSELYITKEKDVVKVGPSSKDLTITVTSADNMASNGVVHIIDGVLIPSEPDVNKTIVELAQATPDLSTLVTAVVAGDLVETLSGEGPFTVFAPTNEAFTALPDGTLNTLLKPENKDQLVGILTFHVVSGEVMAEDLKAEQSVKTVQGDELYITKDDDGVKVGPAKDPTINVTSADNLASNGVVHIIDGVLLPPAQIAV